MSLRHLLRMAKWARHPPSENRVKLGLSVIAICLVLFAIERLFGWPSWLTPDFSSGGRLNR